MRRVRKHRYDNVGLSRNVRRIGTFLRTQGDKFLHRLLLHIIHDKFVTCLHKILGHGLTHNAKTDKTNFHIYQLNNQKSSIHYRAPPDSFSGQRSRYSPFRRIRTPASE